jgi:hypothetical protein
MRDIIFSVYDILTIKGLIHRSYVTAAVSNKNILFTNDI